MNLKNISILLLLIVSLQAKAQDHDFKVIWGEKLVAKKMVVTDILSTDDNNEFYAINQSIKLLKRETFLEKYDNLKKTKQTELTRDIKRGEYASQEVIELNGKLYALNYKTTKTAVSLSAEGIDKNSLRLSGSTERIYNFKLIKGRRNTYGEYSSTVSHEETRIAYVIEHPGNEKSKSVATIKVFDDNFDLQWNKKITLKSTKELTRIYSTTVSDDGIVYILNKVYKPKSKKVKGKRNYEFYLLTVDENGIASEEKLKLKENYINEIELNVAQNGDLMCGGFYSKNGYRSDGTFYMTLDAKDLDIKEYSIKGFDMDFLTQGYSERAKAKANKRKGKGKETGLSHVTFRDFILKDDGGAMLIGEYVHIYETTSSGPDGQTSSTMHYNYDDIYVISISPEGDIEWAEKVSKYQHTTNDGGFYSSFFLAIKDDMMYFMYNKREGKEQILKVVSINPEGEKTEKDLVSMAKKERMRIRPRSCEQISEDEIILFAISKKYNKFARVKIK